MQMAVTIGSLTSMRIGRVKVFSAKCLREKSFSSSAHGDRQLNKGGMSD